MLRWPPLREYSRSRAVIMGTSEYSSLPNLPAALNSLDRMVGLLTGPLCGWPVDRVALLANEPGPGDLPDRLITSFEDATDIALFYYVGHGQIDLANQLCLGLVGSRTEANRRAATSLPFEAIRRAMLDSPAVTKIVILDCCFAGLASLPTNSLAASSDDVLDRTAGSGAYTMAASAAYSPAWFETSPDAVRPQTFFTQYLVDLVEAGIPGQPAGLRLHALFVRLRDTLARDNRPVPVERSVDAARDFVFAHNSAPLEVQRDLDREVTELSRRLAEAEASRAVAEAARDQARLSAEARERALRAEIAERTSELEHLKQQARSSPAMPAGKRQELDEAIDEAQRLLDETTTAHVAAAAADAGIVTVPAEAENLKSPAPQVGAAQERHEIHEAFDTAEQLLNEAGAKSSQPSATVPTREEPLPLSPADYLVNDESAKLPKDLGGKSLSRAPVEVATSEAPPRSSAGENRPRLRVRDLPPDVQMRFWRLRGTIMLVVAVGAGVLTENWIIGLTLAIPAGVIDAIYRSRKVASYANGGDHRGARRRTRWQLDRMHRLGYFALHARLIPNSQELIDHLVVGPTGVYVIDSEQWDPSLSVRTLNGKRLYHGAESKRKRLEHALWEAQQASEILSAALQTEIGVRPVLAIYGPRIPWDIATIHNVDVFTGRALSKYLRRRTRDSTVPLTREQVQTIYDAAAKVLPDNQPQVVGLITVGEDTST
jgi:hypothetical protein